MPDLVEQMYCSQQIHIPPIFPFILKQYCKAAIRTQPYDLLRWSAAYFRCMAKGEPPPVKVRLEYPPIEYPAGLSPGYLKILLKQFAGKDFVAAADVYTKWRGISLEVKILKEIFMLGEFENEVEVLKFIAIAAGYLTDRLSKTMVLLCELLTEEPEGGSAMIPCKMFLDLYTYLAKMNCGPVEEWERSEPQEYYYENMPDSPPRPGASLESLPPDHTPECSIEGTPVASEAQIAPPLENVQPSESAPELTKCESGEESEESEDTEATLKQALWKAVSERILGEQGDIISEEEKLKDELWGDIVDKIMEKIGPDETQPLWDHVVEFSDTDKTPDSQLQKRQSDILKDAIWLVISSRMPPITMKDTIWHSIATHFPSGSPTEILKEELWKRIRDKIPVLRSKLPTPTGLKGRTLPKHPPGYVRPVIKPPPPRIPGFVCLPPDLEALPTWIGTPRPKYRIEVKGIGPVLDDSIVNPVIEYINYWCERQENMVMPRNLRHFLCPPIDTETQEEKDKQAQEIAKELVKEIADEATPEKWMEGVVDDIAEGIEHPDKWAESEEDKKKKEGEKAAEGEIEEPRLRCSSSEESEKDLDLPEEESSEHMAEDEEAEEEEEEQEEEEQEEEDEESEETKKAVVAKEILDDVVAAVIPSEEQMESNAQ